MLIFHFYCTVKKNENFVYVYVDIFLRSDNDMHDTTGVCVYVCAVQLLLIKKSIYKNIKGSHRSFLVTTIDSQNSDFVSFPV